MRVIFFFIVLFPHVMAQSWENATFDFHFSTYQSHHFWNKKGSLKPSYNHLKKWWLDASLEWEISSKNSVYARFLYDHIEESLNGNTTGFEDAEACWTHCFLKDRTKELWGRALLLIPLGKEKASLRYGCFGIEADLLYSTYFSWIHYPIGSLFTFGFRGYHGDPSDQVRLHWDLLGPIQSCGYWLCQFHLDYGIFNGKRKEHFNQLLLNPNYRLLKVQCSFVGTLFDWLHIDMGYFQHLWGKNVGNNGGFICGMEINF